MIIKRQSRMSGKWHECEMPITDTQAEDYLSGALIQDAFPNLSDSQREFILTGITPTEWAKTFGKHVEQGAEDYKPCEAPALNRTPITTGRS